MDEINKNQDKIKRLGEIIQTLYSDQLNDTIDNIDKAYDLNSIFQKIELNLISNMKKTMYLHRVDERREGYEWSQWQHEKLRNLEKFRKNNINIIGEYSNPIQNVIDSSIKDSYQKGRDRVLEIEDKVKVVFPDTNTEELKNKQEILRVLGVKNVENEENNFFGVNATKVNVLINSIQNDVKKAEHAIFRKTDDVYRQTIFKAHMFLQTGASTLNKSIDMATKDFLDKGIDVITFRDGRNMNIASYVEMCLRTANKKASLYGEGEARDKFKNWLVVVSAHFSACPLCEPWQAKILIDDVFSNPTKEYIEEHKDKYKLVSEAMKKGLLHPNCRNSLITYYEGITNIPKVPASDVAKENYNAEQKQRYIERQIRKWKRFVEGSCDETNRVNAQAKVREWQDKLRYHLDSNKQLRINKEREKIYTR